MSRAIEAPVFIEHWTLNMDDPGFSSFPQEILKASSYPANQ
jgi:hypothetical protein